MAYLSPVNLSGMLLRYGPLVSTAAGSIGGTTFQRGLFGPIARTKPLPRNLRTSAQAAARQRTASAVAMWRSMSPTLRAAWLAFAELQPWTNRFGDPVTLTGYQAFMIVNQQSHYSAAGDFSVPLDDTVPTVTASVLPTALAVDWNTGTRILSLTSSDATIEADTALVVFAGKARRPPRCRMAQGQDADPTIGVFNPGTSFPIDITDRVTDVWGDPSHYGSNAGQFFFARALNATSRWPGVPLTMLVNYP